jgi:hypothetical protein
MELLEEVGGQTSSKPLLDIMSVAADAWLDALDHSINVAEANTTDANKMLLSVPWD